MTDERTLRLVKPLTAEPRTAAPLLVRLTERGRTVRDELLKALGLDLDGIYRSAAVVASATGRPDDDDVASQLRALLNSESEGAELA